MNEHEKNQPRRGRPTRSLEQIEASRDKIIQVARDLFAVEGYAGVSMRKIAAKADCTPSMLYTLFPNKKQLLHFIWESIFADLLVELEESYAETEASQRLEVLCFCLIDFWLARPSDYRAIFLIEDPLQSADDQYFVDSSATVPKLEIFTQVISDAQQRGELKMCDPKDIKNVLFCCIQGYLINVISIPEYDWGDVERLKQLTIQALIQGFKP